MLLADNQIMNFLCNAAYIFVIQLLWLTAASILTICSEVEGTVPMAFFTNGTDIKLPSNKRTLQTRLPMFRKLENHKNSPFVPAASSIWNGSSRSQLEALDSCVPDDSAPDADLIQGSESISNLEDLDEFVSVEDSLSAANTPPRFSSPIVNDKPSKTKGSAAFDLF
jgi:hypothetical protein